jgi:hypothetical protein
MPSSKAWDSNRSRRNVELNDMKRYVIVAAAVVALLFVVLIFWLWCGSNDRTPLVSEPPPQALAETDSSPRPEVAGSASQPATADAASNAVTRTQDGEPENARYYREFPDVPVTLYGLVLDQDSNALQTVKIDVEVTQWDPNASPGTALMATHVERQTAADGRFEVSGLRGHSVAVEGFTKRGYEPELTRRHYGEYGPQAGSINEPVVFTLWNTNLHQELISGQKSFEIVPDGRPYLIDLTTGTISESGPGDLRAWIKAQAQMVRGQEYDWSCEVDAISGGLLEQPAGPMSRAPTEGYAPSFKFQGRLKGGQSGSPGEKYFYVRLNDGQEYGSIRIDLLAPYNKQIPGLIRLSYKINPSGSRVLW